MTAEQSSRRSKKTTDRALDFDPSLSSAKVNSQEGPSNSRVFENS
jgi:hypothetical protein